MSLYLQKQTMRTLLLYTAKMNYALHHHDYMIVLYNDIIKHKD